MLTRMQQRNFIVSSAFVILFSFGLAAQAAQPEQAKSSPSVERSELSISSDGKRIVDQEGREIARFSEGMRMQSSESGGVALQGCLCCKDDCVIYDSNGQCVKPINSCTWDFDCSCK